jgi:putative ABC transport system permease protein
MPTNDMKLFTAIIVAIFLAVPYLKERSRSSFTRAAKNGGKQNA